MSSEIPEAPKADNPEASRFIQEGIAIPQFDANPLPPTPLPLSPGNAGISADRQEKVQETLLKNHTYQALYRNDAVFAGVITNNVSGDKADSYFLCLNWDIRMKVAQEDWQNYLKQHNETPDQLTGQNKLHYERLQKASTAYQESEENGKPPLDLAREELIKASGGKITAQQLSTFEATRLQESRQAQTLLHEHQVARHPLHNWDELNRVNQLSEGLNRQESERVESRDPVGQGPMLPTDLWHQRIAMWEQQNLHRVNNGLTDQQRYQQDLQAWEAQRGNYRPTYVREIPAVPAVIPPGAPVFPPAVSLPIVPGAPSGGFYPNYYNNNNQSYDYNSGYYNPGNYNPGYYNPGYVPYPTPGLFGFFPPVIIGFGWGPRPWWRGRR